MGPSGLAAYGHTLTKSPSIIITKLVAVTALALCLTVFFTSPALPLCSSSFPQSQREAQVTCSSMAALLLLLPQQQLQQQSS